RKKGEGSWTISCDRRRRAGSSERVEETGPPTISNVRNRMSLVLRHTAALFLFIVLALAGRAARADDEAPSDSAVPAPSGMPGDPKPLPWKPGPATIELGKDLVLELPEK